MVAADFPKVIDGVTYAGDGSGTPDAPTMTAGDSFLIQPTRNGAASISMAMTNTQSIAAAAPIVTSISATTDMGLSTTGNLGNGIVSGATLDTATFVAGSSQTYTYATGTPNTVTLSPAASVVVTDTSGNSTTYASGAAIPYASGSTYSSGGVSFALSGTPQNGDKFKFTPVAANSGTATVSAGSVDSTYLGAPLAAGAKLTYTYNSSATPPGFTPPTSPTTSAYTITHKDGTTSTVAAGATNLPYVAGDTYTSGGISFTVSGQPNNGDKFYVQPNTSGVTDNRNALLLAGLQTKNTIGNTNYQGSYSQLVSTIGNKTNEINVTNTAEKARLSAITQEQQSESGVNQDEELANMIKNQQAYQAAAKIIQAASDMLNTLLTLGS
jgi:flagellar hook-associated protein 1 FlgK